MPFLLYRDIFILQWTLSIVEKLNRTTLTKQSHEMSGFSECLLLPSVVYWIMRRMWEMHSGISLTTILCSNCYISTVQEIYSCQNTYVSSMIRKKLCDVSKRSILYYFAMRLCFGFMHDWNWMTENHVLVRLDITNCTAWTRTYVAIPITNAYSL